MLMESFDAIKYLTKPRWQGCKPGLERISRLLEMLGNPQKSLRFVHVAGTNGKGSTVSYVSQILIESGYKTGQFTSPFVYDFKERICINNNYIEDSELSKLTLKVKLLAETFPEDNLPTEFELLTAVAFLYFKEKKCDIVVCEVGMGGRFDSTNVISAEELEVAAITPIAIDHTSYLGDTVEKIAFEKAGILKKNCNVVISQQCLQAKDEIIKVAKSKGCSFASIDDFQIKIGPVDNSCGEIVRHFSYKNYDDLQTSLLAKYQPINASTAIEIAEMLSGKYKQINPCNIIRGIRKAKWTGRFEIVEKNPYVVLDGGHNLQGALSLKDSLLDVFENKTFIFVMGVLADKEYEKMVDVVAPIAKKVYCLTPPSPRALQGQKLKKEFMKRNVVAEYVQIDKAIKLAKENANKNEVICAFGSLYSLSSVYKKY